MTPATLRSHSYKDLAQMAKKHGVPGWHSMRKDQLVTALMKSTKQPASKGRGSVAARPAPASAAEKSKARTAKAATTAKARNQAAIRQRISQLQARLEAAKNLALVDNADIRDRLVVMVRDPYWLHVYWELARQSVQRIQAAMGQRWHNARPILRLFEVNHAGDSTTSDTCIRDVEIHGGVNNWYLDVLEPPKSYRLEIGYRASDGSFFSITRSNVVTTPDASSRGNIDGNWVDVAENFDRIYAMSGGYSSEGNAQELRELLEERLRRPMGTPSTTRFGAGGVLAPATDFHLHADAELVIFGATRADAHVMLKGEPVQVQPDGTFSVRLSLPDCRQVIPVVASSADGVEQRTIALAIERNTKQMETVVHDSASER